jgi:hypothetical protein
MSYNVKIRSCNARALMMTEDGERLAQKLFAQHFRGIA